MRNFHGGGIARSGLFILIWEGFAGFTSGVLIL